MEFRTIKSSGEQLSIYSNARHRLEQDILNALLINGIVPAEFNEGAFVVENDSNGLPLAWQKDVQRLIRGLSHVNAILSSLEG